MSELINNRQQRIEIMKSLIRQLHQGSSEEQVKLQLETMLAEADYSDVFLMEMQLIQEGIPAESIQKLCDTHTHVLKKFLDLQETPETIPGHPVHTFIQENRELTRTTARVRLLIRMLEKLNDDDVEEASSLMMQIHQALNDLMDVDKHYKRKEYLLFPIFERNNLPGPPTVMWGKHDEVRQMLRITLEGLQEVNQISATEARVFCTFAVVPLIEAIDEMIYKEEKILFPTALNLLTEQEWYDIYLQSDEYGYCLYAPEFEWIPEGGVQQPEESPAAHHGRIQMPTGSLGLNELIGLFTALPFDVTFVDKDDVVRYFSPGKDRIFSRSRAVLGRKVQYCHPPKSVHIVNQILKDFKAGKQDVARFWINLHGKMVYICYYAVRDKDGQYLGTLEVTQDITALQQLTGERRLLMYDTPQKN